MIVCTDAHNGIAKNGSIPWKIKEDLELFKKITTHTKLNTGNSQNALIMGRKTAETLKCPLPSRINYVLTRDSEKAKILEEKGFRCFDSIELCLKSINQDKDIESIFLIGGIDIYNWGLNNPNKIKEIYISVIEKNYDCDIFFDKNLLYKNFVFDIKKFSLYKDFGFYTYTKKENKEEKAYLNILSEMVEYGHKRATRNATTYSQFGKTLEFDLSQSFPLLTTKKMAIKSIFEELKFFLLGRTDNKILKDKNVHIWDGNTTKEFIEKCNLPYEEDDLGPMYGFQWRHFNAEYKDCKTDYTGKGNDQLKEVVDLIKKDPFSRRILMTSYNPSQSKEGVLYPCHGISIQFYVEEKDSKLYLDCLMHQRSADSFLGVPFNITSYGMLVHILCNHLNCTGGVLDRKQIYPGRLIMVFGDIHIYEEHLDAVKTQIDREPYLFPQLKINYDVKSFDLEGEGSIGKMEFSNLKIMDYSYHEPIKAKMIA